MAGVLPLFGIWWQAKRCAPKQREAEKERMEAPVASWQSKVALVVGAWPGLLSQRFKEKS